MYKYKYVKVSIKHNLFIQDLMDAGEILNNVDGLTIDRLTYFVRAGYVRPRKIKRGSLYFNEFSPADLELIKKAWGYISEYDMRLRSAFERASRDLGNRQMDLLSD